MESRRRRLDGDSIKYILVYMSAIAKLFINGGSQAVRLPKEFRFEGDEVRVRRLGEGVVLEPMTSSAWPTGYWEQMPHLEEAEWARPEDPAPVPIERERELP